MSSNHLRTARLERDYTQKSLADAVGISRVHLNNIEHGRSRPSGRVAFELFRLTGVSPIVLREGGPNA